jgi:hypothetical protein
MLGISLRRVRADLRQMGSLIMGSESHWAVERFGPRGARVALVASGLIFIALLGTWAAVQVAAAWHAGHVFKGLLIGAAALLLMLLAQRIMAVNWRATRAAGQPPVVLPDGNDQSGIWGVGGPSMREPGSTGAWKMREVDRRYDNPQD